MPGQERAPPAIKGVCTEPGTHRAGRVAAAMHVGATRPPKPAGELNGTGAQPHRCGAIGDHHHGPCHRLVQCNGAGRPAQGTSC